MHLRKYGELIVAEINVEIKLSLFLAVTKNCTEESPSAYMTLVVSEPYDICSL